MLFFRSKNRLALLYMNHLYTMSTTREELITINHVLLKRINKLERENKKAMETIGHMTIRISDLEKPFTPFLIYTFSHLKRPLLIKLIFFIIIYSIV
jgi:hypothetical protein